MTSIVEYDRIRLPGVPIARDGTVSAGPLVLANVTFGPYTVHNQAISESASVPRLIHLKLIVYVELSAV